MSNVQTGRPLVETTAVSHSNYEASKPTGPRFARSSQSALYHLPCLETPTLGAIPGPETFQAALQTVWGAQRVSEDDRGNLRGLQSHRWRPGVLWEVTRRISSTLLGTEPWEHTTLNLHATRPDQGAHVLPLSPLGPMSVGKYGVLTTEYSLQSTECLYEVLACLLCLGQEVGSH